MGGQNRLLGMLLGVVAVLVLVIGGLTFITTQGGDDETGGGGASSVSSGVDGGDSDDVVSSASGRLRLASGDPITLDPHISTDALSAQYIVEVFGGLVTITPDLEIALDLAASVDISEDARTYTFTLRDDIFFHSGRRVTAEDVQWSLERASSPELASPVATAYLGDIEGQRERFFGLADDISGIEVIDDRTIVFTLDQPKPYFLAKLTYPTAFVVDRQQVEASPRNWTRRPNGTGPFQLTEWRLGERITLEANPRYHLGEPQLSEVVYLLSGGSVLTRFENGEVDVANVSVNDIDRARDTSSDLNPLYSQWDEFSIFYIAFNTAVPPFDDVHIRRALALSIDRQKIAEVTFNNMIVPATGILPPQLPGFTPGDKTFPFDPERAREELALSSYGSAENVPLIQLTEVGGGANPGVDTQAFVEQWRTELGLEVEIRQTDFGTFLSDANAGRLQMFNGGWIMDYPDPEDILDLKFHSSSQLNDIGYDNPEVDALLEAARTEQDAPARLDLYREAELAIIDDVAWLPLYFSRSHIVVNSDVKGWFDPPMVIPRLRFVSIDD